MKWLMDHIGEIIGSIFLAIVVFFTALNVVLRYFFGFIINWAEEVVLISFIWCCYIGFASSYKDDRHIAIDIIVDRFPPKVQKVLGIVTDILLIITNAFITYLGVVICLNTGNKSTYILRISYVFINGAIIFCFALMTIYSIIKLIQKIKGTDNTISSLERVIEES